MAFDSASIAENAGCIRERIARAAARSGRSAGDITLVAVTKTLPPAAIQAAYDAGLRHFGENRVQEFETKHPDVAALASTWHLIGHLQSNKARRAVGLFHHIDSIDSIPLAQKLGSAATELSLVAPLPVLLQVHLGDEPSKYGVAENELAPLAEAVLALPALELRGLMCIPPFSENPEDARPFFIRLRELRDDLRWQLGKSARGPRDSVFLPVLSMGMSHDFEVAIEEGATEVRIGSAVFGSRPAG